jgi:hypothetical protein
VGQPQNTPPTNIGAGLQRVSGIGCFDTAIATAVMGVVAASVGAGGSGYTAAPTVTISGGGGTGATATCTLSGGAVNAITITAAGSGYTTAPTVGFSGGGGTGATATATLKVVSLTVGNHAITGNLGGSGYTGAPTVSFSGGGGSSAAATAVLTGGSVSSFTVSNAGSGYTSVPTVALTPPTTSEIPCPFRTILSVSITPLGTPASDEILSIDEAASATNEPCPVLTLPSSTTLTLTRTGASKTSDLRYLYSIEGR